MGARNSTVWERKISFASLIGSCFRFGPTHCQSTCLQWYVLGGSIPFSVGLNSAFCNLVLSLERCSVCNGVRYPAQKIGIIRNISARSIIPLLSSGVSHSSCLFANEHFHSISVIRARTLVLARTMTAMAGSRPSSIRQRVRARAASMGIVDRR